MNFAEFLEMYEKYVYDSCAEGDCYPQPCMTGGDGITMHALALNPQEVIRHVDQLVRDPKNRFVAFGLDHYWKPEQGAAHPNAFVYGVAERGGKIHHGMVEYDGEGERIKHVLKPGDFWWDHHVEGITRRTFNKGMNVNDEEP